MTTAVQLTIIAPSPNPTIAYIAFIAHYQEEGTEKKLRERSAFHQTDGRGCYVDGELK